ncbi:MAG: 3,4-dihydroxy-2-butanone-4-phosphate synthase [Candidatus Altiarchaeota archaeon]
MLDAALEELRKGRMILLHDSSDRENEVDIVINGPFTTPETIRTMRKDAGGLICLAISRENASRLSLPYMTDLMSASNDTVRRLIPERTAYGDKPAFSLSINHRKTYTGITDNDRALTITEFAKTENRKLLTENFYAPGHVHLLIAKTLKERKGHTELSIELAKRGGLNETMVLCEMMADDHNALSFDGAKAYAKKHGLLMVDGGEL